MDFRKNKDRVILNFQKGQSLFEVLFAFAIMTLIVVAIVGLATVSIRNSSYSKNKTVASTLAQQTAEWLRGEKDKSWSNFWSKASADGISWCLPSLPQSVAPDYLWGDSGACSGETEELIDNLFLREIALVSYDEDDDYIEATISLKWNDSQGIHEVRLVTDYSNWQAK